MELIIIKIRKVSLKKEAIVDQCFRLKVFIFFSIAFALYFTSDAQLCQGSLGDPVVNITFGAGDNYGSPLGSDITSLSYLSNSCPNDGFYTIANSTNNCFNGSWHSLPEDHTVNDANGYMMIVNASFAKGDFYIKRVDGLCGGITYEFASWINNIQKASACSGNPIKPNVTFKIETISGTVLMTYNSGDIPSTNIPQWKQYGSFFTMPQGTSSVIIRMTNNASGGCGNDLALDDITFRPCGAKVTSIIAGAGTTAKEICLSDQSPITLSGSAQPDNNTFYQWQTSTNNGVSWTDISGAVTSTYTRPAFTAAGTYLYRLSVSQSTDISIATCRVASNVLVINVNALPLPAATNNGPVCEGSPLVLGASGGGTYAWTGPLNFAGSGRAPSINNTTINNAGKYFVTVTSDKGCVQKDSTSVTINKLPSISVSPTAITMCEGESKVLNAVGVNVLSYLWQPSAGLSANNIAAPAASPKDSTTYTLIASNGSCAATATVAVNILKKPLANAGPDKNLFEGSTVQLNGTAQSTNISYNWSPDGSLKGASTLTPVASPNADITYTLRVTSNSGCGTSSDDVIVKVFKNLVVPNAFSPNGDGVNDTWIIQHLGEYNNAEITVFNRYGNPVFTSRGVYKPWNGTYDKGKVLPTGTYYYIIDLKMVKVKYTGWLLIIK